MNTEYKIDYSKYKNKLSIKNKLGRLAWNITSVILFRPFSSKIFRKYRIFILNLFGAKIHYSTQIFSTARIWAPWNLEMQKYSLIGEHVDCYNPGYIKLEPNAIVSQKAYLCTASHDIYSSQHSLITAPIIIKDQAWIGAAAFIGMGVTIGQGAVVGATASVYKDVDPWTVVGGNPAKFIKTRIIHD